MSHLDGFTTGDVDVTILDDAKVRALVRACRGDDAVVARCVTGYIATMLGSWKAGERIPLEEAAPLWLTNIDEVGMLLRSVRLLDDDDRVLAHAFETRFGVALERRTASRAKWSRANQRRKAKATGTTIPDDPGAYHGGNPDVAAGVTPPSVPLLPSVPTDPSGSVPQRTRPRGMLEPITSILPRIAPAPGGIRS